MNNKDIGQWIDNDEGLYNWWKSTRQSKTKFIQDNKKDLTACINMVLNGDKQSHFLAYGPDKRY